MSFNSLQFLVFFPIVVTLFFSLPDRARQPMLLVASYYFYACWKAEYLLLILLSTAVDYACAIWMEREPPGWRRRRFLFLSLATNLGLLFTFKYFNFVNDTLQTALRHYGLYLPLPASSLILPIGISFYTFQELAYTIDVYRGRQPAERDLGVFALYVAFFPQLVAGPISRAAHLMPQFHERRRMDVERMLGGVHLMAWGFFQKIVIADRLGSLVDQIYSNPRAYSGLPLVLATYGFAYQIYCDFAGYSNIAIGAARVLGYDLMRNFDRPYASASIPEFWRRWHISLSSWFRDYVYIPLGGNRVSTPRWYLNLFVVFLVSGLWHGANWTFVAWGALHGIYMLASVATWSRRERLRAWIERRGLGGPHHALRVLITFHLALVAWVFFRARSFSDAIFVLSHAVGDFHLVFQGHGLPLDGFELAVAVSGIVLMELAERAEARGATRPALSAAPLWLRWPAYYAAAAALLLFGYFGPTNQFIYFQF